MSSDIKNVISWIRSFLDDVYSPLTHTHSDKVDKVTGKGLSTNDYTTTEKNKLANIESEANKTVVDSSISSSSTNPVENRAIYEYIATNNGEIPIVVVDTLPTPAQALYGKLYIVTRSWEVQGLYVCCYVLD